MKRCVERLDLSDPQEIESYERAFYAAFAPLTHNRLIRRLWLWDEPNRRLKTRIPYEDQRVFVARNDEGGIRRASGVNVALREFQSAQFGFSPPADRAGCCEFLTYFAETERDFRFLTRDWGETFQMLREAGFHRAYATTASPLIRFYERMGAVSLEERIIDGEGRHFLLFDLSRR